MTQQEIREVYKNLPHITKVWLLNGEVHIHEVKNGVCVSFDEPTNEVETTLQNTVKPKKKK